MFRYNLKTNALSSPSIKLPSQPLSETPGKPALTFPPTKSTVFFNIKEVILFSLSLPQDLNSLEDHIWHFMIWLPALPYLFYFPFPS